VDKVARRPDNQDLSSINRLLFFLGVEGACSILDAGMVFLLGGGEVGGLVYIGACIWAISLSLMVSHDFGDYFDDKLSRHTYLLSNLPTSYTLDSPQSFLRHPLNPLYPYSRKFGSYIAYETFILPSTQELKQGI